MLAQSAGGEALRASCRAGLQRRLWATFNDPTWSDLTLRCCWPPPLPPFHQQRLASLRDVAAPPQGSGELDAAPSAPPSRGAPEEGGEVVLELDVHRVVVAAWSDALVRLCRLDSTNKAAEEEDEIRGAEGESAEGEDVPREGRPTSTGVAGTGDGVKDEQLKVLSVGEEAATSSGTTRKTRTVVELQPNDPADPVALRLLLAFLYSGDLAKSLPAVFSSEPNAERYAHLHLQQLNLQDGKSLGDYYPKLVKVLTRAADLALAYGVPELDEQAKSWLHLPTVTGVKRPEEEELPQDDRSEAESPLDALLAAAQQHPLVTASSAGAASSASSSSPAPSVTATAGEGRSLRVSAERRVPARYSSPDVAVYKGTWETRGRRKPASLPASSSTTASLPSSSLLAAPTPSPSSSPSPSPVTSPLGGARRSSRLQSMERTGAAVTKSNKRKRHGEDDQDYSEDDVNEAPQQPRESRSIRSTRRSAATKSRSLPAAVAVTSASTSPTGRTRRSSRLLALERTVDNANYGKQEPLPPGAALKEEEEREEDEEEATKVARKERRKEENEEEMDDDGEYDERHEVARTITNAIRKRRAVAKARQTRESAVASKRGYDETAAEDDDMAEETGPVGASLPSADRDPPAPARGSARSRLPSSPQAVGAEASDHRRSAVAASPPPLPPSVESVGLDGGVLTETQVLAAAAASGEVRKSLKQLRREHGKNCHNCKTRKIDFVTCLVRPTHRFCDGCLRKLFNVEFDRAHEWDGLTHSDGCPICRRMCPCVGCRKRQSNQGEQLLGSARVNVDPKPGPATRKRRSEDASGGGGGSGTDDGVDDDEDDDNDNGKPPVVLAGSGDNDDAEDGYAATAKTRRRSSGRDHVSGRNGGVEGRAGPWHQETRSSKRVRRSETVDAHDDQDSVEMVDAESAMAGSSSGQSVARGASTRSGSAKQRGEGGGATARTAAQNESTTKATLPTTTARKRPTTRSGAVASRPQPGLLAFNIPEGAGPEAFLGLVSAGSALSQRPLRRTPIRTPAADD